MDYITTANVLLWLFLTIALYLVFLSHWLVSISLFPSYVAICSEKYAKPVTVTLIGLLALFVPIAIGSALLNALPPALKWIGIIIIGVPILIGLFGTAGLALRIGKGMPSPQDENQPWKRVLRGGTALAFTFLLPILGQLVAIPLVLASGLGASVLSWISMRKKPGSPPALPGEPVVIQSPS